MNNNEWNKILKQVDKKRFSFRPNPWTHPIKEDFDTGINMDTPSSEFPDTAAQTYSTTDALTGKDIVKQVKKKKPKKKKKDRIAEKSLLLSAKLRKKSL
jgi:hypothetical protein